MSIDIIVSVYADTSATTAAAAKIAAKRIESVVQSVANTPSSFHGGTWLYPYHPKLEPKYAVGGLFQFARSLRAPQDAELNGIIRNIRQGIGRVVGAGKILDVRALVTDRLPWYGGESTTRPISPSRSLRR